MIPRRPDAYIPGKKKEVPKNPLFNLALKLKEDYERDPNRNPNAEKSKYNKNYFTKILAIATFIATSSQNIASPLYNEYTEFNQLVNRLNSGEAVTEEMIDKADHFLDSLIVVLGK